MIDNLIKLLRDEDLVWSNDFEAVRRPLAGLIDLIGQLGTHQFDEALSELSEALLDPNPVSPAPDTRATGQSFTGEAGLYLGIMQLLVERDKEMGGALTRMFKQLDA
jgi:hypothetical protein